MQRNAPHNASLRAAWRLPNAAVDSTAPGREDHAMQNETPPIDPARSRPPTLAGARAWIISDGKAGHEALTRGVAEALGVAIEWKRIAPSGIWKALAPWGPVAPGERFGQPGSAFAPPWPDIALRCGPDDDALSPCAEKARGPQDVHRRDDGPQDEPIQRRPLLGAAARQAARPQRDIDPHGSPSAFARPAGRSPQPGR